MITLDDVSVRYRGAERDALHGVSLSVPRRTITAVVGPNGSGKSTLVRALLGQVALSAGGITIAGRDATRLSPRERAREVAFVTQVEDTAFPRRVSEYVALGRFPHGDAQRLRGRDAIASAVARAEVEPLLHRHTDTLSGGEWQRVRVARALAQGGDALVLDEPTAHLDVAHEMHLFELLERIAETGAAVLLVSHELNLVARFAAGMILLNRGTVAAAGAPAAVMQREVLERVYEWPLLVADDPITGTPALIPLRQSPKDTQDHVHIR